MSDILGNHGLAQALRRDEHDVARLGDEVQAEHRLNQGPVDFLRPIPVIVDHGFESLEATSFEATLEAAPSAVFLF